MRDELVKLAFTGWLAPWRVVCPACQTWFKLVKPGDEYCPRCGHNWASDKER